ncbi:hypothetical protein D3C78_1638180 [compost metagenome]
MAAATTIPKATAIAVKVDASMGFSDAHDATLPTNSAIKTNKGARATLMSDTACFICIAGSALRVSI